MDPATRQAFAQWTLAQPAVSAFVHAWVQDRAERDDVLQEVAVAVLESYEAYDPSRPFLPWALGIARHLGCTVIVTSRSADKLERANALGAAHARMGTGRFGRPTKMFEQRRVQHILYQGRFAGTGHARHAYQTLQGKAHVDVFEVVLGCA